MQVKKRAVELANAMKNEDGVAGAVKAFYKQFPREISEAKPRPVASVHKHTKIFSIRGCFGFSDSSR